MIKVAHHVCTTICDDGPDRAGGEMDVQDVAPALLAHEDIVQIANRKFNGDIAGIRVLVNAHVEQKFFQIGFRLVQLVLDRAKPSLTPTALKTAQEIAEWIGVVGAGFRGTAGRQHLSNG